MLARTISLALVSLYFWVPSAQSAQFATSIPMSKKGTATYYVTVDFDGSTGSDMMIDTGSDYVAINTTTLEWLQERGQADYVKEVGGTMADGRDIVVPIYRIANLSIGCCCIVHDVEAAVFEGTERQILGLSALKKVAPFALSLDPAHLMLSDCQKPTLELAQH